MITFKAKKKKKMGNKYLLELDGGVKILIGPNEKRAKAIGSHIYFRFSETLRAWVIDYNSISKADIVALCLIMAPATHQPTLF